MDDLPAGIADTDRALPSLVNLARSCYADIDSITSEAIREALQHLSPEALAWVAHPGGPRPVEN